MPPRVSATPTENQSLVEEGTFITPKMISMISNYLLNVGTDIKYYSKEGKDTLDSSHQEILHN